MEPDGGLSVCSSSGAAVGASAQTPGPAGLYTPEDLLFLRHMIVHHEQALELSGARSFPHWREPLVRFARQIDARREPRSIRWNRCSPSPRTGD